MNVPTHLSHVQFSATLWTMVCQTPLSMGFSRQNIGVGCHFLLKIFHEQCSIIEENNKRGKTRDLFRKTGNIKGTFCPKIGPIKDKNGGDLVEAEEIKKRWKDYTEALYNKNLNEPDYYDGVVSHPEPDILECEVKWGLGRTAANKAIGGDGIPGELLKILKNEAIKVLY